MKFELAVLTFHLLLIGINANWFDVNGMFDRPFTCLNKLESVKVFKDRVSVIEKTWNIHPVVVFDINDKATFQPIKCCATYDFADLAILYGANLCDLGSWETYKYYIYKGKDIVDSHCGFYKYHSEECFNIQPKTN
jgi:hypothetical protein